MVIAHTATAFRQHFQPRIIKNMDLETVSHFATPNHRKITEMCPKWVPGDPQIHPKIDKNGHLEAGPQGACWVSMWTPGSPKWSLRVAK